MHHNAQQFNELRIRRVAVFAVDKNPVRLYGERARGVSFTSLLVNEMEIT